MGLTALRTARPILYLTVALGGVVLLAACHPMPGPSPQPNPRPGPTDPRKAGPDPAVIGTPIERFG